MNESKMAAPVGVPAVLRADRGDSYSDYEEREAAIAALAALVDKLDRVASGLEADGRMPDAMTKAVAAKRIRAAIARFGGAK